MISAYRHSVLFFSFFLCFFINISTQAQKVSFHKFKLPPEIKSINALLIENSSILWIASGSGLYKLVGDSIQKIDATDKIQKLRVNTITIDQHGNKWLGTYSGKLLSFKDDRITKVVDFSDYLDGNNGIVTSIAVSTAETEHRVLLTASDGQVLYFNMLTQEKGVLDSPANSMLYSINYGYGKTIWLCASDGLYTAKINTKWKQKQGLYLAYGIMEDNGKYWAIGRNDEKKAVFMLYYPHGGLSANKYVWKEFQMKKLSNKYARFYELGFTLNRYAWITSDVGLIRYSPLSGNVKEFNPEKNKGFKIKETRHIAVQDDNTIWVSSSGNDLYKLEIKY